MFSDAIAEQRRKELLEDNPFDDPEPFDDLDRLMEIEI
jgi:hypothetical protein